MNISTIINKSIAAFAMLALVAGSFAIPASWASAQTAEHAIYFEAFVGGEMATAESAHNAEFPLLGYIDGVPSEQDYTLRASGYLDDPTPYQSYHSHLPTGSDFGVSATLDGNVIGESCDAGAQFSFQGYTSGNTLGEAAAGTPSLSALEMTNVTSDKTVILWYDDCGNEGDDTVNVHIHKFIDGVQATAENANDADFSVETAYTTDGLTISSLLPLDEVNDYQTVTADFASGSDYTTEEDLDGTVTASSCDAGADFRLAGYTSGNTLAEAEAATIGATLSLTNVTENKFVIVWNENCEEEGTDTDGEIGGDVEGGITPGTLAVTSIEVVDGTATADGTFENGWEYVFNITVPEDETNLSMKFADWVRTGGTGTIAVANNMRISSAQADNSGATITLSAANTYSTPALHITGDLNPLMDGKQVQVTVEVAVPASSFNGSYTTQYGVQTQP